MVSSIMYRRLTRVLPVLNWSRDYKLHIALEDLIAGITVGLTLIPQCIAYASLAGMSAEYGLYASLWGGVLYLVFGTIPQLFIAPTALISLFVYAYSSNVSFGHVPAAILLCFLSGIIELLCGILHLGFLLDFVSSPVVTAFTSAGALTIGSSQVKTLLGLKFSAETFIDVWIKVFSHIKDTNKYDASLGFASCMILLFMRKLKDFGDAGEKNSKSVTKTIFWFVSVARNAFVVVTTGIIVFLLDLHDINPFTLTTKVPSGLPPLTNPLSSTQIGNSTLTAFDMIKELGAGIFIIPFISILGNVAIAKAFGEIGDPVDSRVYAIRPHPLDLPFYHDLLTLCCTLANGKVVNASQEMIAVGVCNLIGSFFSSFPMNASFSRAAVSNASGVRTPIAGICTTVIIVFALTVLTPYFSFIPKATLSAVIICAVIFMVEVTVTKMIWKINKIDLFPFVVTLVCSLTLGIEIGILVGVCIDLILLLYSTARPEIIIEKITGEHYDYTLVTPSSGILFPSAEFLREKIMKNHQKHGNKHGCIVIDCERIDKLDFTAGKCLGAFISDFERINKNVVFYQPNKSVAKVIQSVTDGTGQIAGNEADLKEILKNGVLQTSPVCSIISLKVVPTEINNPPTTTSSTSCNVSITKL